MIISLNKYLLLRGGRSPSRDLLHGDSMIGTMNSDYSSKHGISTIPKGDCAQCGKPIIGQNIIRVANVGQSLGIEISLKGKVACDFLHTDALITLIKGMAVHIVRRTIIINSAQDVLDDGQTYCRRDFFRLFAPKCNGCQNPITSNFITALGTHWHPECFVCQVRSLIFSSIWV
ncbi:unnamed protein product [Strongylus vulgaris]|uniref:LIM zinc-binding domain-containing protein n=1 Tax=Strongylus vulgaris TaxID=40348 RepID=A0A3P7JB19_STRVU|nr:unnamed protein product [Strongylus vulgaris]